jgi:hypothetical protein
VTTAKVAVVKSHPSTVLRDIELLLSLGDVEKALDHSRTTILKDNISWHMPLLSANTTPWQLEGTIVGLRNRGITDLSAVHNNTVVTDPYKGGRLNRLTPLYEKYSVPEWYNFLPQDMTWETYEPKARMRVLNRIYPEGIRLPQYFFGKNIVHLPTVKCHIYTTTTGAMKNAFGGLLNTKRHYTHSHIHETLVDLLAIQREIHSGIFTVMDGTLCGNGPGPRTMIPEQKDLMLSSSDSVAIDAIAAKMMGFDPMNIEYIRGQNMVSRVGGLLWFGSLRNVQKVFFRTPLVYLFVFGSSFFHDYLWWPTVGKARMRETLKTDWGKLFEKYPLD